MIVTLRDMFHLLLVLLRQADYCTGFTMCLCPVSGGRQGVVGWCDYRAVLGARQKTVIFARVTQLGRFVVTR